MFPALLAVITPGDHGAEGKENGGDRKHHRVPRKNRGERIGGHRDALARVGVRVGAAHHEHQAGHEADHDGIDEGLEQGHQTFAQGLFGSRCRVGDGGRADPRLVAEGGAAKALDQHTHEAPEPGLEAERRAEDGTYGRGDLAGVHRQHTDSRADIEEAHARDENPRHLADAPDAPHNDQPHHRGHHEPEDRRTDGAIGGEPRDLIPDDGEGLVGLEHIAPAEAAPNAHHGKDHREHGAQAWQPALGQAVAQVDHRPARHLAVLVDEAKFLSQGTLGEFRTHAQEPGEHHPEDGARPAQPHRHRDTGDIAQAHRGGERRRERLEMADLSRCFRIRIAPANAVDGVAESAKIDEAKFQGEVDRPRHQPDHHGGQNDLAGLAVVPEGHIEEENRADRCHDIGREHRIERRECILDLCVHGASLGRTRAGE